MGQSTKRLRCRPAGSISGRNITFISSLKPADQTSDLPCFLFNEYLVFTRREKSGRRVKLSTHFQLLPMLRMSEAIHPVPHVASQRVKGQLYL